ncbi:hypothetical protein V6N11_034164 [Hibiscus sabdariffa]|uniref:DUF659 domain-containing protein n=1 Tax=Hibiscus sabdariffa TaxID=183260 RepID=A0ABR2S1H8_9ROSI
MTSQHSGEPNFASSETGSASGSGSISSSQNENASPLWNYVTKLEKKRGYWRNLEFPMQHLCYNKLRTSLLLQEKSNVDKLLQPIKATWQEKGVTIVCDGWSDPTRKPLINFMATSGNEPMFLKAVNCFGEVKDKFFIANLMKEVIDKVGHQNVVQIITDNASNCKGAGEIIESMYPHIYWTPCVVHILNLALKNICLAKNTKGNEETYGLCNWITEIHGDAVQIKNFIMNHNMRLVIFQRYSPLKLLLVVDTRFASIIVMLKRFKLIKRALQRWS